jgi:NAD(P)H-hydrate epimerase
MIVTCEDMRALESAAVAAGVSEEALMEEAGLGIARAVQALVPRPDAVVVFAGKGHNAGDAFVAARHWLDAGWPVVVRGSFPPEEWRPLTAAKWSLVAGRLGAEVPETGRLLLVDGLLGLGSGRALRPPILDACRELNRMRRQRHGMVVAIDGPSGVDFDTGEADADAVQADLTATVAAVKGGLLAEAAVNHVGRLTVVPVAALEPRGEGEGPHGDEALSPRPLRALLPAPRPFDFHKGQAGLVLVVAGSRGMVGAARFCAAAAVHGGAGLVTLAVPKDVQDVVAAALCPEVMVRGYRDFSELAEVPADALAVGPGLGRRDDPGLAAWLAREARPAVIDADALNALAALGAGDREGEAREARLALARADRLLTPHPGEMNRLLAAWGRSLMEVPRARQARGLSADLGAVVLLKGARTLVAAPGHPLAHNTTGHPGMATGGMGDVLTGLCAALMAQGLTARAAACLGSWLLGRAAELALARGAASPESLRASVVLDQLGPAFDALRYGDV